MTQIITDAVAGPFRIEYAGPSGASPVVGHIGVIGSKGIRQIRRYSGEDYSADMLGNSTVESVYMGGDMFLEFELEEANLANAMCIENPFRKGTLGGDQVDGDAQVGVPGTFATSYAGSIILYPLYSATGTIHTTAGAQTTPVRTYGFVTLAMGFEKEKLFASKRRVIPIRLRCYPYITGSGSSQKYVWYTVGAVDSTYRVD